MIPSKARLTAYLVALAFSIAYLAFLPIECSPCRPTIPIFGECTEEGMACSLKNHGGREDQLLCFPMGYTFYLKLLLVLALTTALYQRLHVPPPTSLSPPFQVFLFWVQSCGVFLITDLLLVHLAGEFPAGWPLLLAFKLALSMFWLATLFRSGTYLQIHVHMMHLATTICSIPSIFEPVFTQFLVFVAFCCFLNFILFCWIIALCLALILGLFLYELNICRKSDDRDNIEDDDLIAFVQRKKQQ